MNIKSLSVFLSVLAGTCAASAATYDAYWTGNGDNNKWGNSANWSVIDSTTHETVANAVPNGTSSIDYRVHVDTDATIEIESDKTYTTYWFYPGGTAQVTLTGSGTLKNANWTFIDAGASMIVDGPTVTIYNTVSGSDNTLKGEIIVKSGYLRNDRGNKFTLAGNARVIVEGGVFGSTATSSRLTVTNNAEVIVKGGVLKSGAIFLRENDDHATGGAIRLWGGTLSLNYNYSYINEIAPGATFDYQSGTVVWSPDSLQYAAMYFAGGSYSLDEEFVRLLPPKGANLIVPTSTTTGTGALNFYLQRDYDVGGTVYVTNATSEATGNFTFQQSTVNVLGGATFFANRLNLAPAANNSIVNLDLEALNLGAGGVCSSTTKSMAFNFLNGLTFGAWGGDWTMDETGVRKISVEGPLTFATTDALDATQGDHAITAKGLLVSAMTEINVTGGGSATLGPRSYPEQLRRIRVADGATLALTESFGTVKTMDFALGANSTLKLDISNGGVVDVAAKATFGAGSKIVVTSVPATLTAGTQYPIFNLPPQKGDPTAYPTVELPADVADGWSVRWTANSCYLGDGLATEGAARSNYKSWTGSENGLSTNVNNWANGDVLSAGTKGSFSGTKNTIVTNADETGEWRSRMIDFTSAAGAFVIRGNTLNLSWPYAAGPSATISSSSKRPVVIESDIDRGYQWSDSVQLFTEQFRILTDQDGSISLLGESKYTLPLDIEGDIRFGGTWTASELTSTATGSRRTSLTVLPNATVTIEAQTNALKNAAYLAVAEGGSMSVAGTAFGFGPSVNTHFVDGSLTVGAPFVVETNQIFRGSGTLALAGGVTSTNAVTGEGIRLEGDNLTFVPAGAWATAVPLTVREKVTIAPTADWTFPETLNLDDHATLTISGEGRRVTLQNLATKGDLVIDGATLVLSKPGVSVGSITLKNGGAIALADALLTTREGDVLTTTESTLAIQGGQYVVTSRESGIRTVYTAAIKDGLMIFIR